MNIAANPKNNKTRIIKLCFEALQSTEASSVRQHLHVKSWKGITTNNLGKDLFAKSVQHVLEVWLHEQSDLRIEGRILGFDEFATTPSLRNVHSFAHSRSEYSFFKIAFSRSLLHFCSFEGCLGGCPPYKFLCFFKTIPKQHGKIVGALFENNNKGKGARYCLEPCLD